MAGKRTIRDEVFGKITYRDGKWFGEEKVKISICERIHDVKLEIDSVNEIYDEIKLGLMDKIIAEILMTKSKEYNEEQALKDKERQRRLFKRLMIDMIHTVEKNMEEAALQEYNEVINSYDKNGLERFVGKEKAMNLFPVSSHSSLTSDISSF